MSYANGRCIVTKKVGPCLVLPAGTFSKTANRYLSKEGCDKLVECMKSMENGVPGTCVINRQYYDECAVIPRGVINPKLKYFMSPDAINGMASELAKLPDDIDEPVPAPEPVKEPEPEPVPDTPKDETPEPEPIKDDVPPVEEKSKKSSKTNKFAKKTSKADPSSGETIEE